MGTIFSGPGLCPRNTSVNKIDKNVCLHWTCVLHWPLCYSNVYHLIHAKQHFLAASMCISLRKTGISVFQQTIQLTMKENQMTHKYAICNLVIFVLFHFSLRFLYSFLLHCFVTMYAMNYTLCSLSFLLSFIFVFLPNYFIYTVDISYFLKCLWHMLEWLFITLQKWFKLRMKQEF